jgi:hypothetical protein
MSSAKQKRFEAKWLQEKGFQEKVQQTWEAVTNENPTDNVLTKLNKLHGALHEWDANVLQNPRKRLKKAQDKLEKAMNGPMNVENETVAKEMAELIDLLLKQEEMHWMQCSRANWLRHGDRNTSFFHHYATARRKKNFIKKLKNDQGEWSEGTDQLNPLIFHYFANLFMSEVNELDPAMMDKIMPRVTDLMNKKLLAPFTPEDVKKVVFSIGDFKAPGPDGLHAVFYKKIWSICGEDITQEVLLALNLSTIPKGWNDTTVVLIPKVDEPGLVTQFHPISLCNVIYKIISKMLAGRLKEILPDIISPMQSAFVLG